MAKREDLGSYEAHRYGPSRHGSNRKLGGLNVLSFYISSALRNAKIVTQPPVQNVEIGFREDPVCLEIFQRHPKTAWLYWRRDYRDLDALAIDADNQTIGEFAVPIAEDLQQEIRAAPSLIQGFPFELIDEGIQNFRCFWKLSRNKSGNRLLFGPQGTSPTRRHNIRRRGL